MIWWLVLLSGLPVKVNFAVFLFAMDALRLVNLLMIKLNFD